MATFTANPTSVTLQAPIEPYQRADIVLHGVDHSRASFEGRLFFNNPNAGPTTPTDDANRYAGSFWVFGHGGCAGDEGHCEVPTERRPFDLRPEHQLTPMSLKVIVTDKLKQFVEPESNFTVSVVPFIRRESAELLPDELITDLLHFDRLDLLTYQ
jgi:hypothetical protein